jgi:hypothetical protein
MWSSRRRGRRRARLVAVLGVGAITLGAVGSAQATTPLGVQARISLTGADGDAALDGSDASVAYNPVANQYLSVWEADTSDGTEIFGRLIDAAGAPVGAQFAVSDMGPAANVAFDAEEPAVAFNTQTNEYLVVWSGDDDRGPLVDDEEEIFAQRLTAAGAEVGPNDRRISDMGPNGNVDFSAQNAAVTYNPTSNQYLVAWEGNDTVAGTNGDDEIFIQRLNVVGAPIGTNDQRVSDNGPLNDTTFSADNPSIAHNSRANEYLVAWEADDGAGPLVEGEDEIYVQRLASNGAEVGVDDRRISSAGPDGNADFEADVPDVAHNPLTNEYLVVWEGEDDAGALVVNEDEIYAQRLDASGAPIGIDDQRISAMGPDGTDDFEVNVPRIVVNVRANEYLVTWDADDNTAPLVDEEQEIYAQRLGPDGAEIGSDDIRVSVTGFDGVSTEDAFTPAVAYASQSNEYLIAWDADSTVAPLVNNKFEVYARRFGAGAPLATAPVVCKTLPAPPTPTPGDPNDITLTVGQLLINQRIDQAAIRRANGVQAWLDDRIEGRDLCQGALGAGELAPGIVTDAAGPVLALAAPDPRPIVIAAAQNANAGTVTLTVGQILINQRISQAAIRRLNALKARMDDGLTGGDVEDRTLTRPVLASGLRVLVAPTPASPPAASLTVIAAATPGDPSQVTLSTTQILINQRISQAAVRRANELIARIEDGLVATDVKDGSVTALDLAPGVAP